MKGHKKVLYIVNIPSPYMVTFFNMLANHVNLTVIFEKRFDKRRPSSWRKLDLFGFNYHFLKGITYTHEQLLPFNIKKYFHTKFDHIFIQNFFTPSGMLISRYLRRRKMPYSIVSEGGDIKKTFFIKDRLKKEIMTFANQFMSSSKHTDDFLLHYGAKRNHIKRYPFTSLNQSNILKHPIDKNTKVELKEKYNISQDDFVILTVGRLFPEKNHEYIIENLKRVNKKFVFILIGDGTQQNIIHGLQDMHHIYMPYLEQKILFEYYQMADIFVLASKSEPWGLVVNEAMSQGCVVATSQYVNASKELLNETNGYIFDIHDPYSLSNLINDLNSESLEEKRIQSLETIQPYSFEHMVEVFKKVIEV